jgi:ribosome-associated protein
MTDFDNDKLKSKSQRKRDHHALQELGHSLVQLSARQLKKIPLSERAREEIVAARELQRGALQRQLRYLAGLLEEEDPVVIRRVLAEIHAPARANVRTHHALEQLRAEILRSPQTTIKDLATRFPTLDGDRLNQLAAQATSTGTTRLRAAREIFRYLAQFITAESVETTPR